MPLISVILQVNGEQREVTIRPADTLLYVLREKLGLTGAKPGCLNGDCGACTVNIDGWPMKSCLMLGIEAVGKDVLTIEGLTNTPIQQAFVENFAFQCGYCTPGFIMNCHSLLQKHPEASDGVMKEWLESNICRCTSYEEIKVAMKAALETREQAE
ncbi:(2Fe-2S)-binding protein [Heyndrickxia ginsengihumi]|uniref:(2Fe-2S)-binding protein n=1 Tax=Heyndrickxia ginsengihumi TaxID=363870 RepID=UPI003D1F1DAC